MSSRSDKNLKAQKERHHAILRELVQEVPNKTCADCLAKGPRWSSWSLGVFVCIRCAGIHRNLGVHISKVKSVDLDSWSVEQIEHILKWGNKRAAEYYECYLPKDFTRPQGNHAVESFIRNKYEKKLYIMKDGEPEPNPESKLNRLKNDGSPSKEKESKVSSNKRRERPEKKDNVNMPNNTILNVAKEIKNAQPVSAISHLAVQHTTTKSSSMNDLLSLDTPQRTTTEVKHSASSNDLLNFGDFSSPVPHDQTPIQDGQNVPSQNSSNALFEAPTSNNQPAAPVKSTKESILSLYSSGNQQKLYGVPGGVYMQPQQGQLNMMASSQQQMKPNSNMMFNYQMQSGQMNQMNQQMQGINLNTQMNAQPLFNGYPQQQPQQQGQQQYQQPQQQQQQLRQFQQQQLLQQQQQQQQSFNNQYKMNQPVFNNQMNFSQPSNSQQQIMYNGNQMNSFNQNMGNNFMANGNWTANQQQTMMGQPIAANGMMGTNGNFMGSGGNMVNTMNNQLWN